MVGRNMIPLFKIYTPDKIGEKIQEVFDSGFITEGEYSDKFETEIQNFLNSNTVVLVNSGTSSLSLAYHLCDIGPGDEVITSPMTCMATNAPIVTRGAKIVWADIDPTTGNICPKDVANKITNKTKAIVGVHWAGQPFDVDSLMNFERSVQAENYPVFYSNHIPVIEDSAHALGSKYKGKPAGTLGDYGCFSFQAIKHLTTVDGGALWCKDLDKFNRAKKLKWFGLDRTYKGSKWEQDIVECGYKFHMNNVNAAIGLLQMQHINEIIFKHKNNSLYYDQNISNTKIKLLRRPEDTESSSWIYSLLVDDIDSFKNYMETNGVMCDRVHVRNDKYSVFSQFNNMNLPGVNEFTEHMINIPVGWWLNKEDIEKIVDLINSYN